MSMLTVLGDFIAKSRKGTAVGRARKGRTEKFMGNAERVPNERIPAPPRAPTSRKSSIKGPAIIAGGTAAVAAGLYGVSQKEKVAPPLKGREVGSSATSVPSKAASPAATGSSTKKPEAPAPKPATSAKAKSGTSSSSSRGKTMKGKELADYLGLGADSAVRTYMETGKHKYEPKYPTSTGQKAGTPTKASQRKQKTR